MAHDVASARQAAGGNRLGDWVQEYLTTPGWANEALAAIIRHQNPVWIGPIEVELTQLRRCCGPEEEMRYTETTEWWERSVAGIQETLQEPSALPPLLVRPMHGVLSIPDGNHRHEAMRRKGWRTGWVLLWCDREEQFRGRWQCPRPQ